MHRRIEMSQTTMIHAPLETGAHNVNRQNAILSLLSCPSRTIHHPEERRLNPGHSSQTEWRNERLRFDCPVCNLRRIGLVYSDGALSEVRANFTCAAVHNHL